MTRTCSASSYGASRSKVRRRHFLNRRTSSRPGADLATCLVGNKSVSPTRVALVGNLLASSSTGRGPRPRRRVRRRRSQQTVVACWRCASPRLHILLGADAPKTWRNGWGSGEYWFLNKNSKITVLINDFVPVGRLLCERLTKQFVVDASPDAARQFAEAPPRRCCSTAPKTQRGRDRRRRRRRKSV